MDCQCTILVYCAQHNLYCYLEHVVFKDEAVRKWKSSGKNGLTPCIENFEAVKSYIEYKGEMISNETPFGASIEDTRKAIKRCVESKSLIIIDSELVGKGELQRIKLSSKFGESPALFCSFK